MNLVPFIKDFLQFNISEEEILNIAGILDTNCFEIILPSKKIKARGLYLKTAMFAHDCIPNTKHFVVSNFEMKMIATVDIKKGETIFTSYSYPLRTTIERRLQLKQAKCFDCCCSRCKNSTDCIRCRSCGDVLCSINPLENYSNWCCRKCDEKMSSAEVIQMINEIRNCLENLNKKSVEACNEFLKIYENILTSESVFMIDIKYALCLLYGNIEGYMFEGLFIMNRLTKNNASKKILL